MALNKLTYMIFLGAVTLINARLAVTDRGCRTPNGGVGNCIPIENCNPIIYAIEQHNMPNKQVIETLRAYQCDFQGQTVKVCCADEPILFRKPSVRAPTPVNYDHKNLHRLPRDCGVSPIQNRITYGNKTSLFEFPWMALLISVIENDLAPICAGTIINKRYILTAAHCIANLGTYTPIRVHLGEHNINSKVDCHNTTHKTICAPPVQDIEIAEVIPHSEYNRSMGVNDIGLIRLSTPINTDVENAKPICLPTTNSLRYVDLNNDNLIVTGWGLTERNIPSPELLKLFVPVVNQQDCQNKYRNSDKKISYKQICAGGNKTDACTGDSGGPLQRIGNIDNDVRFIQYGIISYGSNNCGRDGIPGVYTRVDYYMDWILDNIKP